MQQRQPKPCSTASGGSSDHSSFLVANRPAQALYELHDCQLLVELDVRFLDLGDELG
jgi:hypothetical protein